MGAFTVIFMYLIFGFFVGMTLAFIRSWKEIVFHAIVGALVIFALVGTGGIVLSGNAGNVDPITWYEIVGYVAYFIGLIAGDDAGETYYEDLSEARDA